MILVCRLPFPLQVRLVCFHFVVPRNAQARSSPANPAPPQAPTNAAIPDGQGPGGSRNPSPARDEGASADETNGEMNPDKPEPGPSTADEDQEPEEGQAPMRESDEERTEPAHLKPTSSGRSKSRSRAANKHRQPSGKRASSSQSGKTRFPIYVDLDGEVSRQFLICAVPDLCFNH